MSSGHGSTLAHSRVASIRSGPTQSHNAPSTPQTPPRSITTNYGSPASIRADDDVIVLELGSRRMRAGFAGDCQPKATLSCGPEEQRRAGDFRRWQEPNGFPHAWDEDYEMWQYDLRRFELGLLKDKLDQLLREAFTKSVSSSPLPQTLSSLERLNPISDICSLTLDQDE